MDKTLLDDAIAQKKKIGFLESAQFQLDVLKKTLTIEELQKMLKEFDEQKIELDTLLNAYVESDVKKLEELSFKDLESEKERYEILFFKRNEAWVPQIKKFAQEEGDVFVAVGAGHLFGPRGVLKLLEKEGLKATRVSFNK